ncbi:MAG: alpha/beta fold hydrolase [Mariprofundaceae bacterium]|nr:alpha/beta fold hydrolase [Mariprofundaceae bacterium]
MNPLVFIHGWGQSQQIWHQQRMQFPHATYLNLPGHGGAKDSSNWLEALASQLPNQPCLLLGWSLGGMLSMQLALAYPQSIKGLVLLNSTPCFHQKDDWTYGCSKELLRDFKEGMDTQPVKTMARFFSLMLHGENIDRRAHQAIARAAVDSSKPNTAEGMHYGLKLLATLDLRQQLSSIQQPTWIIHGDNDAVVPVQAGNFLAKHIPHTTQHHFQHCGHMPFLTQNKLFNSLLESWCQKN